jgi:hypothetical protein
MIGFQIARGVLTSGDITRRTANQILRTYSHLERPLEVDEGEMTILSSLRVSYNDILKTSNDRVMKNMAKHALLGLTSSASNDIYEEQISLALGLKNIDTKHGWDGVDPLNKEPYEYKPTKVKGNNYFGALVYINDESENKINNISPHKDPDQYNNEKANFVIAIINKETSDFICIHKFKEYILKEEREKKLQKSIDEKLRRRSYYTCINKCIELSEDNQETYYSWKNTKYF